MIVQCLRHLQYLLVLYAGEVVRSIGGILPVVYRLAGSRVNVNVGIGAVYEHGLGFLIGKSCEIVEVQVVVFPELLHYHVGAEHSGGIGKLNVSIAVAVVSQLHICIKAYADGISADQYVAGVSVPGMAASVIECFVVLVCPGVISGRIALVFHKAVAGVGLCDLLGEFVSLIEVI